MTSRGIPDVGQFGGQRLPDIQQKVVVLARLDGAERHEIGPRQVKLRRQRRRIGAWHRDAQMRDNARGAAPEPGEPSLGIVPRRLAEL